MDINVRKLTAKIFTSPESDKAMEHMQAINKIMLKRAGLFARRMAGIEEVRLMAKQAQMIGEGI